MQIVIDMDDLCYKSRYGCKSSCDYLHTCDLYDAPTIIEADKAESEDNFGMYKGWAKKRESVYKKLGYAIYAKEEEICQEKRKTEKTQCLLIKNGF